MKLYLDSDNYIDTNEGVDLSLPIRFDGKGARAWYVDHPVSSPVEANGYIGSVISGGSTNFRNVFFNPHGHGTHTECLGHITPTVHSVNQRISNFHFVAQLITVDPLLVDGDLIITKELLENFHFPEAEALLIRTFPNSEDKKSKDYSHTNPPYLALDCIDLIEKWGVQHLLIDLPSVDREMDEGKLSFHNAFWNTAENEQSCKTITEFIFVPDTILDGKYVLNIQVAAFENDAAPSRPLIYAIKKED